MADLLLELFSEEIPARMQRAAAKSLRERTVKALGDAGLEAERVESFVTPRRLTLFAYGLPDAQPDRVDERKGPKVGSPSKATEGFLRSVGKTSVDECEIRTLPKGDFYFVVVEQKGQRTTEVLPDLLDSLIHDTTWPKSMRWGSSDLRWVRPLHRIVALLGSDVIPCSFGTVQSGRTTEGHRFLAGDPFDVEGIDDYRAKLERAHVVLDSDARSRQIRDGATALAEAEGLTLLDDPGLLAEVSGLVEDPVPLLGHFDDDFLRVPPEILSTAMRSHQKYFSLAKSDGSLAPAFVVVANQRARDGGQRIVAGNERVLRARLANAAFFWDQDRRQSLESRFESLDHVVYQQAFGNGAERMRDKAERLTNLSRSIAEQIDANPDHAERAGRLSKCDLTTGVVGEFPELQGLIGRYYALHDGDHGDIADAIATHYQPKGPTTEVPQNPVGVSVALADKIDTLVGFFAIDEKPTGSKDPYALRRAALGVLRIILENGLRLPLISLFETSLRTYPKRFHSGSSKELSDDLLAFFADRLEVHLRDSGIRHDLIRAAFAAEADNDLWRLVRRVEALQSFLETPDGENLLAAVRRASNIVRIEEKKDGRTYDEVPDAAQFTEPAERALGAALEAAVAEIESALANEQFAEAMSALASLRTPVDEFFEAVTVNAEDPKARETRLRLLSRIRGALATIADLSRIRGD